MSHRRKYSMTAFQAFMDQRGFTQYRLAKLTGFSKTQVSEWQHGKHRPSLSSVRRLAITLHLPFEDLKSQLEIRERVQNARTLDGTFVPKSRKNSQSSTTIGDTNDSGRTGPAYCTLCHQILRKAA
jgi:transcriptional regulator with XRE-family HTH domain